MRVQALFAAVSAGAIVAACVPHRDYSPDQIQHLTKLDEVMDVQSTVADPQMKKRDQGSYSDADFAAFADAGNRIQVTSAKIHQFSKGPEFDAFADRLHKAAESLSRAAEAKDGRAASAALGEMKDTCKACHSKFK